MRPPAQNAGDQALEIFATNLWLRFYFLAALASGWAERRDWESLRSNTIGRIGESVVPIRTILTRLAAPKAEG